MTDSDPQPPNTSGPAVWSGGNSVRREFGWRTTEDRTVFVMASDPSDLDLRADGCVVVIVGALGIESQGSNAALDAMESTLSNAGHVVVRFDPPGMGNAPGDAIDGPEWEDVTQSTADMLSAASRRWPSRPLVVLGVQLGVAAAVEALDRLPGDVEVVSLVAWAPAVSGKKFLRNMRMFGAVANGPPGTQNEVNEAAPAEMGSLEAGGYCFGPTLQRSLLSVNLATAIALPVASILIVERDDIATAGPWVRALTQSSSAVHVITPRGTRDARFDDPEKGVTPSEVLSAISDWVDQIADRHSSDSPENAFGNARNSTTPNEGWLEDSIEFRIGRVGIRETVCITTVPLRGEFSAASLLVIRSEPVAAASPPNQPLSAVIVASTGANTSSGPGRMNARLARRLASVGHLVLRYDRRGVGGSDGALLHRGPVADAGVDVFGTHAVPTMSSLAYAPEHQSDLAFIVHGLAEEKVEELDIIGTCSGATLGYRFALSGKSDVRIRNLVTVNQILWDNDVVDLAVESPLVDAKIAGKLAVAMRSPLTWPKLLATDLDIRQNAVRVARHLKSTVRTPKGSGNHPLNRNLKRLATSGIQLTQVFDAEEVGQHYLREHAGHTVEALRRSGVLESWTIEGAGHTFGSQFAKRWLEERIAALLRPDALDPI
jgi:alpha-beta hydrolase superfamily lysophospholipase